MSKQNKQVADFWEAVSERKELGFWSIPGWQNHQNILASGNPKTSWLQVFHKELHLKGIKPGCVLSLGCGSGYLEREMLKQKMCVSIEGCDLSQGLLEIAKKEAEAINANILYYTADLNKPSFDKERYDLIVGSGIFHHIEHLENLFENLNQALKPEGRLIIYDYVGPNRFQWTKDQILRCNFWLRQLPERFKKKQGYPQHYYFAKKAFDCIPFAYSNQVEKIIQRLMPEKLFAQFVRLKTAQIQMDELIPPHPSQFLVTDPSEAIRSSEIIPTLSTYFKIEKNIPQGGTLAQPLFSRSVANFLHDRDGKKWAARILSDERRAIQKSQLSSDLIALIAKKI